MHRQNCSAWISLALHPPECVYGPLNQLEMGKKSATSSVPSSLVRWQFSCISPEKVYLGLIFSRSSSVNFFSMTVKYLKTLG